MALIQNRTVLHITSHQIKKPVPLIPIGSLPEQMKEENEQVTG